MDGPTPHLSWLELACNDGTPYPAEWRDTRAIVLALEFEEVRKACGDVPIRILSAYRTVEWNVKIGGSMLSQHKEGRALDMMTPRGIGVVKFASIVNRIAAERRVVKGIGIYRWGVHMDVRPSLMVARWTGDKVAAEVMSA